MKKILFITVGVLPVPATRGGAVETLITSLVHQNEIEKNMKIEVFSIFASASKDIADSYKFTDCNFVKIPNLIKKLDLLVYNIFKKIFPQKNYNQVRYIFQRLYFISKCKKKLLKCSYDKIILENHPSLLMVLKNHRISKKYKRKVIYHLHNDITNTYMCSKQLHEVDRFFSVSDAIADRVSQKYFLDRSKFILMKNCIDTTRFNDDVDEEKSISIRRKYDIKSDEHIIIFTGRLVKEKGIDILIKAFVQLNVPNLKLMIVGGVSYTLDFCSEYEKQLHDISNNNVIFTGFVPYSQIHHYYHLADIGVFPSICFEAAGLTIIEAMACGLPVISVDTGGISEYTGDGAILLKNDESLEMNLRKAISSLIIDKKRMIELKSNARKKIENFSEKNYYERLCELI